MKTGTSKPMDNLENSEKKKHSRQRILVEDTLEHKIIFAASQLEMEPHPCGGYYCNLAGEFYKVETSEKGEEQENAFEPPLSYVMGGVRVDTPDPQRVLRDIYHFLREKENSSTSSPSRKIGFI